MMIKNPVSALMKNKKVNTIILLVCAAISLLILVQLLPRFNELQLNNLDDYPHFWKAARADLAGQDPYNPVQIINPPWILTVFIPFALFDYFFSRLLWLITNIIFVIICTNYLWKQYGGSPNRRWLAWLVVFLFYPTISIFRLGQVTLLVLIGLIGFTKWSASPAKWWTAGAFIAMIALKPQLVYLFWFALLLWGIRQRAWKIILSGGVAIIIGTAIPMMTNPSLLSQFFTEVFAYPVSQWATPTIGSYLRLLFGVDQFWLQFIPALFGIVWLFFYWKKHAQHWRWLEQLPYLLLVSVVTSPFIWTYDYVLLFIPAVQVTVWMTKGGKRLLGTIIGAAYWLINILVLILSLSVKDIWFIWMAPVFLLLYWIVERQNTGMITNS